MSRNSQRYTGNNHVVGHGFHLSMTNEPLIISDRGREWLFEWHYYFGPVRLHKRNKEPLTSQPDERSRFWLITSWWKDQGCRVNDGVAIWDEPPIVTKRFRQVSRNNYVEDKNGDKKMRFWNGYEQLGNPSAYK